MMVITAKPSKTWSELSNSSRITRMGKNISKKFLSHKELSKLLFASPHLKKKQFVYLFSFFLNNLRYEKVERYEDSLVYLDKALKIDATNELISTKIKEIHIKVSISYLFITIKPFWYM